MIKVVRFKDGMYAIRKGWCWPFYTYADQHGRPIYYFRSNCWKCESIVDAGLRLQECLSWEALKRKYYWNKWFDWGTPV
jgi:hypothetical protein